MHVDQSVHAVPAEHPHDFPGLLKVRLIDVARLGHCAGPQHTKSHNIEPPRRQVGRITVRERALNAEAMAHRQKGMELLYRVDAVEDGRAAGVVGEEMSGRVHPDAGQRAGGRDRHRRHDGRKHFTRCATDFQNLFTLSKISTCEKRFAKRKNPQRKPKINGRANKKSI